MRTEEWAFNTGTFIVILKIIYDQDVKLESKIIMQICETWHSMKSAIRYHTALTKPVKQVTRIPSEIK